MTNTLTETKAKFHKSKQAFLELKGKFSELQEAMLVLNKAVEAAESEFQYRQAGMICEEALAEKEEDGRLNTARQFLSNRSQEIVRIDEELKRLKRQKSIALSLIRYWHKEIDKLEKRRQDEDT